MAVFLGGTAWPVGWQVGFVQRPYEDVLAAMDAWPARASPVRTDLTGLSLEERVGRLEPLQTPPRRELVLPAGARWTAHLVGNRRGGDSVPWVGHLSRALRCAGARPATHIPIGQYPYPCTMFELLGPQGCATLAGIGRLA